MKTQASHRKFVTQCMFDDGGTQLQGYIDTTYDSLVAAFGEPTLGSGDGKVQAEWIIVFDDGTVATVYDWKHYGQPVRSITDWNIGGHNEWAWKKVGEALGQPARPANGYSFMYAVGRR